MEPGVTAYRCYMLDKAGAIRDVEVIECRSDEEARRTAAAILAADETHAFFGVEVWDRARPVLRHGASARA